MCETCGVTIEQYEAARRVAMRSCIATFYEDMGVDPVDHNQKPRPMSAEVFVANDRIGRHHAAHPGLGLTRDELIAEFAQRTVP